MRDDRSCNAIYGTHRMHLYLLSAAARINQCITIWESYRTLQSIVFYLSLGSGAAYILPKKKIYIALGHVRHLRVVLAYSVEPLPVSDQWRDFPFFAFQSKDQKYIFHVLSFRFSSYFPRVARFAFS